MINIVIISKHEHDREKINGLLAAQKDFQIINTGADGYDALHSAMNDKPDIIIMDYSFNDSNSLELAPAIKRYSPSTAIIVLYSSNECDAVDTILKTEISGCFSRQEGFEKIISSVWSVFHGGLYVSKQIRDRAAKSFSVKQIFTIIHSNDRNCFNPTELHVFNDMALGYKDEEIAKDLNICAGTVRNCISRVMHKTGMRTRSQMILYALFSGLLKPGIIKEQFHYKS